MSDLGQVFGRFAGTLFNKVNGDRKLKCYDCKKITEHISISYADLCRSCGNEDLGSVLLGGLNDYNPAFSILLGNSYACSCCQRIRIDGGLIPNYSSTKRVYLK